MTWTNTGGGDHEGADWTPADALIIGGVHYNIETFTVTTGYTVHVNTTAILAVYANTVSVVGTINGNARGYAGGLHRAQDQDGQGGTGPGAGGGGEGWSSSSSAGAGGGGAGFGGAGLAGSNGFYSDGGTAGSAYSTTVAYENLMGSGGGAGGSGYHSTATGGDGGNGGAGILLCAGTLSVTGTINANGENGENGSDNYTGGGGAGAGGGIILFGNDVTATGTFSAAGATRGAVVTPGGNSGGGRIKFYYVTSLNTAGISTSVVPGSGATTGSYTTQKFSQCTSSVSLGQTFTIGSVNTSLIDKILLWVTAVNASGDFILKVWDSSSKNTEYGSKTVTISSTGSVDFQFADWVQIPDGETQYYMELTTAGAGDIEIGVYGFLSDDGGDCYRDAKIASRIDLYYQIYSVDHSKGAIVYNTGDSGVKANISNVMLIGAEHQVNVDSTGSIFYDDNFTTNKYLADYSVIANVTHDSGNNELDIADDGYIAYSVDCKYSVDGIPTLTAQINITAGIPTIQISTDGATWYDIDDAIVDDSLTEYDLTSTGNLVLDGNTSFYFRIDCVKGATATCSVKSFQLDVATDTTAAQNPYIFYDTINTFKCDQDAESGINCTIELISEESILQPIIIF